LKVGNNIYITSCKNLKNIPENLKNQI